MKGVGGDFYNAREISELLLDCGFLRAKQTIARDIQQNLKTLGFVKKSGWYVQLTKKEVAGYLEILEKKSIISAALAQKVIKELEKKGAAEPARLRITKDDLSFGEKIDFYENDAEVVHRVLLGRVKTISRVY